MPDMETLFLAFIHLFHRWNLCGCFFLKGEGEKGARGGMSGIRQAGMERLTPTGDIPKLNHRHNLSVALRANELFPCETSGFCP